jgi:hypothetical protein
LESQGIGIAFEKHNIGGTNNEKKFFISPIGVLQNQRLSTHYLREGMKKFVNNLDGRKKG